MIRNVITVNASFRFLFFNFFLPLRCQVGKGLITPFELGSEMFHLYSWREIMKHRWKKTNWFKHFTLPKQRFLFSSGIYYYYNRKSIWKIPLVEFFALKETKTKQRMFGGNWFYWKTREENYFWIKNLFIKKIGKYWKDENKKLWNRLIFGRMVKPSGHSSNREDEKFIKDFALCSRWRGGE